MGIVTSFQNILDNIFIPLFEVTVDPDSHPQLHVFLKQVCHFLKSISFKIASQGVQDIFFFELKYWKYVVLNITILSPN